MTGGAIINPKEISKDSEAYQVLNGPSGTGTVKEGYSRVVHPGDIIKIPPDVFHGWVGITDDVDYLSVRPDPDHVLPAGHVNPALKK